MPLVAPLLPRRLAAVLPTTYSSSDLDSRKADALRQHLGFPHRTFVHCGGFAPAAPRRARVSVSEPVRGLPLSRPLWIIGMVGLYPNINLIQCSLILERRSFKRNIVPDQISYPVLSSVSRDYSRLKGRLTTCYSAVRPGHEDQ